MFLKGRSGILLGIGFSVAVTLIFLLVVGSFPGMEVPPAWFAFGTLCAVVCSACVSTVLVKQTEKIDALHEALAKTHADLEISSSTDATTGLLNRDTFLKHVRAETSPGWIVLGDPDYFKQINDRHGHAIGDKALAAVGEVIRANTRADDLCGRLGGEEFAVFLTKISRETALAFAERIRRAVQDAKVYSDKGIIVPLSMSLGVAPCAGSDYSEALRNADAAMYAAKNSGRNKVVTNQSHLRLVGSV